MYTYLITMIGDKPLQRTDKLGSLSNKPLKGNMESNQPFKGSKPLKGLFLTFFIFTQFAFAATINIPADYTTIRKGTDK